MGLMSIMDYTGDTKIEWNPENEQEVEAAKKTFEDYIDKDFKAFRLRDGEKGRALKKFDRDAERVLLVPPMVGG